MKVSTVNATWANQAGRAVGSHPQLATREQRRAAHGPRGDPLRMEAGGRQEAGGGTDLEKNCLLLRMWGDQTPRKNIGQRVN